MGKPILSPNPERATHPGEPPSALAGGPDEVRHLVVLGLPRSGTTLLMNVLGEHPDVSMLDEDFHGGLFRLTGSKVRGVKLCVPNQIQLDRVWHPLYRLVQINGMLRKSTFRRLRPMSRYSIRDYAQLDHVSFICLLRDPAANLDAVKRRVRLNLKVRRALWHRFIETMAAMDARSEWDVTFVSFEKLVRAPGEQIRLLCERLALPYHERMLEAPRFNHRYPASGFDAGRAVEGGTPGSDIPDAEELGLASPHLALYERLLAKSL